MSICSLNRLFVQAKVLEEVVDDKVVRVLLFKVQDRVFVILNELSQLFFVDIVACWVKICNLLWRRQLVNFVNRSLDWVQIVEHSLIITCSLQFDLRVWVVLSSADARSGR